MLDKESGFLFFKLKFCFEKHYLQHEIVYYLVSDLLYYGCLFLGWGGGNCLLIFFNY